MEKRHIIVFLLLAVIVTAQKSKSEKSMSLLIDKRGIFEVDRVIPLGASETEIKAALKSDQAVFIKNLYRAPSKKYTNELNSNSIIVSKDDIDRTQYLIFNCTKKKDMAEVIQSELNSENTGENIKLFVNYFPKLDIDHIMKIKRIFQKYSTDAKEMVLIKETIEYLEKALALEIYLWVLEKTLEYLTSTNEEMDFPSFISLIMENQLPSLGIGSTQYSKYVEVVSNIYKEAEKNDLFIFRIKIRALAQCENISINQCRSIKKSFLRANKMRKAVLKLLGYDPNSVKHIIKKAIKNNEVALCKERSIIGEEYIKALDQIIIAMQSISKIGESIANLSLTWGYSMMARYIPGKDSKEPRIKIVYRTKKGTLAHKSIIYSESNVESIISARTIRDIKKLVNLKKNK